MGICQNRELFNSKIYSTKALLNVEAFQGLNFYISTDSLLRIDADVLVLFADSKLNLRKNPYLLRLNPHEVRKVQEFAEAQLAVKNSSSFSSLGVITFSISQLSLRFSRLIVVCLEAWTGHKESQIQLYRKLEGVMSQIRKNSAKTIAITEYNPVFGVPSQIGCKNLLKSLQGRGLEIVTVVCSSVESQNLYIEAISSLQSNRRGESFVSAKSIAQSNYY